MKNRTLLHIPHASAVIPEKYLNAFYREKLPHELAVMTDHFCDELFECGRDRIVFPVSRLVCDVERFRRNNEESMAKIGMGAVYRSASDLSPLRVITEPVRREIMRSLYDRHHAAFTKAVEKKLNLYDDCLIVDCHSFYPVPLKYEPDQSADRPDFCIGTSFYHTPEALTKQLARFLTAQGYRVKIDSPFSGTIVPMAHYLKDKRVRSVMIEVNRKLYMDVPGVKNDRFDEIRALLTACIEMAENSARP